MIRGRSRCSRGGTRTSAPSSAEPRDLRQIQTNDRRGHSERDVLPVHDVVALVEVDDVEACSTRPVESPLEERCAFGVLASISTEAVQLLRISGSDENDVLLGEARRCFWSRDGEHDDELISFERGTATADHVSGDLDSVLDLVVGHEGESGVRRRILAASCNRPDLSATAHNAA